MPLTTNYAPIIQLISQPRLDSFKITFRSTSDYDLYGVYIWGQHASASLYPLAQNLEITLRNAIDQEAKQRFGNFWWNTISTNPGNAVTKFRRNITKAEDSLNTAWEKKERNRLGLRHGQPIPTPTPVWSHDQIVAATEFSTWQFILADSFSSPAVARNNQFLWPLSISRCFKNHSIINNNQHHVRKDLIDLINELREYRNRLFHHEPIWIKDPSVVDARTAINTIRNKINKFESVIKAIDSRKHEILNKVGLFNHARRICSESELHIYRYENTHQPLTKKYKNILRPIAQKSKLNNQTIICNLFNETYGIYKIR